jgi:hypothetical protein
MCVWVERICRGASIIFLNRFHWFFLKLLKTSMETPSQTPTHIPSTKTKQTLPRLVTIWVFRKPVCLFIVTTENLFIFLFFCFTFEFRWLSFQTTQPKAKKNWRGKLLAIFFSVCFGFQTLNYFLIFYLFVSWFVCGRFLFIGRVVGIV